MANEWDAVAETYAASPQVDWFDDFLARHIPADLSGRRVLDLGCGHGWFSAELHRRGADVTAVDASERLLEIASRDHAGPTYVHRDVAVDGIEGTFDLVVALMALMDLPSLARVRPATRALVATILHPAFFLQKTVDEDETGTRGYRMVRNYLEREPWRVDSFGGHTHFHRPLMDYVSWCSSLGLGVTELFEPPAQVYDGWRRAIPTRLGIAAYPVVPGGGGS